MLHRRWTAVIAIAAIAAALAGCGSVGAPTGTGAFAPAPVKGSTAPPFSLRALDGSTHSLAQYRGHVVLVNFWATWCIPCRAEVPELEVVYRSYQARGVVILGVDWKEDKPTIQPFVDDRQVTYPVLLDADGKAYSEYQVPGLPQSYVIDRTGKITLVTTGISTRDKFEAYLKAAGA